MAFPQILAISSGSSSVAALTHTMQYPSGTSAGELLILLAAAGASAPATPNSAVGWVGDSLTGGTNIRLRYAYRYANGSELLTSSMGSGGEYDFTTTTTTSEKISYVVLRCSTGSMVNFHRRNSAANVSSAPVTAFRGGSQIKDYTIINTLAFATASFPTATSTGYTFLASQSGATDAPTVWIQKKELTSAINTNDSISAITLNQNADYAMSVLSLTFVSESSYIYRGLLDTDNSTAYALSTTVAGAAKYVGQTFPGNGSSISSIGFHIRKSATGSPTGILTCSLYLMTGSFAVPINGTPTGSRLVSSSKTVNLANTDSTYWQYEEFPFNPPYRTDSEQYYVVLLESPDVAGGTVYIGGSSGTGLLWTGNSVSSSDGTNWVVGNDLAMYVQTLQNDNQYYFNSGFESASIANNDFEGWYSFGPGFNPSPTGIKNISISSASSFEYVTQSIIYDSTVGKKVYSGWTIKDNPSTATAERAQISVDFWDDPNQFREWKSRTRIKLHPDWNYIWQNFTGSITTGSTGTGQWNGWIDLSEVWLQDATRKSLVSSSNTAGSARWSLYLAKASASLASPANFFWRLKAELQAPIESEDKTIWPPDFSQDANGARFNRVVPVPIDEWFWLEWYFKKGSGSVEPDAGRVTIKIETDNNGIQTLFDEINTTQYVSASTYLPQITIGSFDPVKVYASSSIVNFMSASNKEFSAKVSDFQFYNLDYPTTMGSFPMTAFSGTVLLKNYRRILA